jgi:hypothetical protein
VSGLVAGVVVAGLEDVVDVEVEEGSVLGAAMDDEVSDGSNDRSMALRKSGNAGDLLATLGGEDCEWSDGNRLGPSELDR